MQMIMYLHLLKLILLVSDDLYLLLVLCCSSFKYFVLGLAKSFQVRFLRLGKNQCNSSSGKEMMYMPLVELVVIQYSLHQLFPVPYSSGQVLPSHSLPTMQLTSKLDIYILIKWTKNQSSV